MEPVGSITAVYGRVTAVTEAGLTRDLSTGDALFAEEMLVAAMEAGASVRLTNGGKFELAPGTVAVLDSDVCDHDDEIDDGSAHLRDVQLALRLLNTSARGAVA
jgi:hypothetical protein